MKRFLSYFTGIGLSILLVMTIYHFIWPPINASLKPVKIINSTVKLNNQCKMDDDVFIVVIPESGQTAHFHGSIAYLTAPENFTIKLAVNPLYPDFVYDGLAKPIKDSVTLIAECSTPPRLDTIFGAMKDQFGRETK